MTNRAALPSPPASAAASRPPEISRSPVSELLEVLDDRERKIIFQRFGLDGGNPKTLEVIGKKFGVTRERIRQLQNVALDKLRRALRKKETPQAAQVVATGAPFRAASGQSCTPRGQSYLASGT